MTSRLVKRAESIARKFLDDRAFHHSLSVAARVREHVGDNDVVVAAAVLHDVLEDSDARLNDLPEECREIVAWLTDNPALRGRRAARKREAANRIARAPWQAVLIKLCDRTDNVLSIAKNKPDFYREAYRAESWELFHAIRDRSEDFSCKTAALVMLNLALEEAEQMASVPKEDSCHTTEH